MSQQTKYTKSNHSTLSVCTMAIAATIMTVAPAWTNAHEPVKSDANSMPTEQMDHSKMDGMSMTGDVDYDFAANMRKHHQKAVDMSQVELKNGKNPQMIQMAKDIIAAQKKEITVLDQWIEAHKKELPKTEK